MINFEQLVNISESKAKYKAMKNQYFEILNANHENDRLNHPRLNRVVFLMIINQRTIRQIVRYFKAIYDDFHFYYFHVDLVSIYYLLYFE